MTNKERYKKAFSEASGGYDEAEVICAVKNAPEKQRPSFAPSKRPVRALITAAAVVMIIFLTTASAYAANIGGFRDKVLLWIGGKPVEGELEQKADGEYRWTSPGRVHEFSGTEIDPVTGESRPMTADELISGKNARPEVWSDENGVYVSYHDRTIDVTEDIADDHKASVVIETDEGDKQIDVEFDGERGYYVRISDAVGADD